MDPTHLLISLLVGAGVVGVRSPAPAQPEIARVLDTRPDRGNVPGSPRLTGPTTPICHFYNDDLEVSLWHGPADMTFSLAKNDVWDRRYFGDAKRPVDLDDVRRACMAAAAEPPVPLPSPNGPGGSDLGRGNSPQALYLAYDFPCPKPVGQVIVRCPDLAEETQWTAGQSPRGELVARAAHGAARAQLQAFVHRTRNLMVLQGAYSGLTKPLSIMLYRHQDTTPPGTSIPGLAHYGGNTGYDYSQDRSNGPLPPPEAGADGRFFWVRQRFGADKTFPRGFECVLMGAIAGAQARTSAQDRVSGAGTKITLHPLPEDGGGVVGWLKEIRLEAERMNNAASGSVATAALSGASANFTLVLTTVTTRDAADPLAEARRMLTQALAEGPEALACDSAAATRQQLRDWRLSRVLHYNATSCTFADATPWHGDYHFNEACHLNEIICGQLDEVEPWLRLFEEMRPALQRNAREVYHCGGLAFPLVHYPLKSDRVVYGNVVWEWGLENTGLMLQPFWQVYQYTGDVEFLRQRAYPMLREGARFYADYVTKGEDGYYHVIPTVSQEHWGFTPRFKLNRDSVGALSFVKYLLRACIEASETLGVDAEERGHWQEIIAHLAPYPTLQTPEGPVFCDVRDAPSLLSYNITANLVNVLWAEDISLDSPPETLELARRSLRAIPDQEHSMRPGYLHQIALVLGMLTQPDLSPQGRVLSWPGRIHLYAGVPAGAAVDDHFAKLLAVGGFEVSARHVGTEIRGVQITSRVGNTCRLKNPWPGAELKIIALPERAVVPHRVEGDTITFPTRRGATYAVLSGPELPQADLGYVAARHAVGRWSFRALRDGVIPDESTTGHAATLVGQAALAEADGRPVLRLDGRKSYAQVARAPQFDFAANESFAIEARVRFPAALPPPLVPIVCSMDNKQYCFTLADGRLSLYLSSPRGDVYCQAVGDSLLTDGRWHTVRGVRDVSDETISVWVDGRLEGQAADLTAGDFASSAPVTIGAYLWGERSRYAQCEIAEVTLESLGRLQPEK